MEFHLTWNDKKYICKERYCEDREQTILDIYNADNTLLADIENLYIPDAEDEKSCNEFKETMNVFLTYYYDA